MNGWIMSAVAGLSVLLVPPTAWADSVNFKTPSGNIFCGYFDYDGPPVVRCDIRNYTPSLGPPPADCDLDWGDAFEVTATGRSGEAVCHGDTVMSPDARVLPYGKVFSAGGITCLSQTRGLTCENGKGHGFFLSRSRQRVY
jgi:hypothetical protein